jgi:hypothetical protein
MPLRCRGTGSLLFNPSIAHQSYCRSEQLSSSSNNYPHHIRSALLVTGAGRHGGLAPLNAHRVTLVLLVQLSSSSAASTFSYRHARHLAAVSVYDHQRDRQ